LYWPPQLGWAQHVGATPMITWDPVNGSGGIALSSIARGADDSYLRASAQLAKAYGKPLLIRFAHEMNLRGSPFGPGHEGNTPAQFVAAWRHVVSVFRSAGATNVKWVWSPNVDCGGKCPFDAFFPGDSYVDYVALDGYNYAAVDGVPWMSFDQIFAPSYRDLTRLSSKPVIIAETASVGDGDAKATWIQNAFLRSIPTAFPRVRAVVWFDRDKEANWKVNSSPASEQAWRAVVDSPIYQGRL
jgi:beta-mannanase